MNRFYPNVSERFEKRFFLNGFEIVFLETIFKPFTDLVFEKHDYLRSFKDFVKPVSNLP